MKELQTEIKDQFVNDEMESVTIEWSFQQTDNEEYLRQQIEATRALINFKRNLREVMAKAHKIKVEKLTDEIIDELETIDELRRRLHKVQKGGY